MNKEFERDENELARLSDLIFSLVHSVQYRPDRPFDALLCQHMLFGEDRIALKLALYAVDRRLDGKDPGRPSRLVVKYPGLARAYESSALQTAQALEILSEFVGSVDAECFLRAYQLQMALLRE